MYLGPHDQNDQDICVELLLTLHKFGVHTNNCSTTLKKEMISWINYKYGKKNYRVSMRILCVEYITFGNLIVTFNDINRVLA